MRPVLSAALKMNKQRILFGPNTPSLSCKKPRVIFSIQAERMVRDKFYQALPQRDHTAGFFRRAYEKGSLNEIAQIAPSILSADFSRLKEEIRPSKRPAPIGCMST